MKDICKLNEPRKLEEPAVSDSVGDIAAASRTTDSTREVEKGHTRCWRCWDTSRMVLDLRRASQ